VSVAMLKRKTGRPPVDPLREWLREALAEQAKATGAVERQKAAITRMVTAKNACRKEAESAKEAIDAALAEDAEAIAAAAASGSPAPASGVRRAREAEQDAVDKANAQAAALERLRSDLPVLRRAVTLAQREVETAVCEVFVSPAEKQLAEALKLKAQLDPIIGVLAALFATGSVGSVETEYGRMSVRGEKLDALRKQMFALYAKPPDGLSGEPWVSARAALLDDPNAPLDAILDVRGNADGAATF
jgi:hypothetical protein